MKKFWLIGLCMIVLFSGLAFGSYIGKYNTYPSQSETLDYLGTINNSIIYYASFNNQSINLYSLTGMFIESHLVSDGGTKPIDIEIYNNSYYVLTNSLTIKYYNSTWGYMGLVDISNLSLSANETMGSLDYYNNNFYLKTNWSNYIRKLNIINMSKFTLNILYPTTYNTNTIYFDGDYVYSAEGLSTSGTNRYIQKYNATDFTFISNTTLINVATNLKYPTHLEYVNPYWYIGGLNTSNKYSEFYLFNSEPQVTYVNISVDNTLHTTTCNYYNATDYESDAISFTYKWYNNSVLTTQNTSSISNSVFGYNETWTCGVIPYDLYGNGSQVNSSNSFTSISYIGLEFYNEETNTLLNGTNITVYIFNDVYSLNTSTTSGAINLTILSPNIYQIRYSATGYNSRLRTIDFNDLTTPLNYDLYLLSSAVGAFSIVKVVDQDNEAVEGATIKIYREYPPSFVQVNEIYTNFEGESNHDFQRNTVYYRFEILVNGITISTTNRTFIFQDILTHQLILTTDEFLSIKYKTGTATHLDIANNSGVYVATYTFAGANIKGAKLVLYQVGTTTNDIVLQTNTSSSLTGALTVSWTPATNVKYLVRGYIDTNTSSSWFATDMIEYNDNDSTSVFGLLGVFISIIIILFISFLFKDNPSAVIIVSVFGLIGCAFFGFINITYGAFIFIAVVAGIIIMYNKV